MRSRDHLNDSRQHRLAPDSFSHHQETAGLIHSAAGNFVARLFFDRHGFTREHRFIDRRFAFNDFAVDWNFLARAHAKLIADVHFVERDFQLFSVADNVRFLRSKIEQRANRSSRATTRAKFQDLSEQHEHGDNRSRLEVDTDFAVLLK